MLGSDPNIKAQEQPRQLTLHPYNDQPTSNESTYSLDSIMLSVASSLTHRP